MAGESTQLNKSIQTDVSCTQPFQKLWSSLFHNNSKKQMVRNSLVQQLQPGMPDPCLTYGGYSLRSAFQPIYSITHRQLVGYEALLRASIKKQAVSPEEVFNSAKNAEVCSELDIICHCLHTFSSTRLTGIENNWLFLNTKPSSLTNYPEAADFIAMLKKANLHPHQIVVEILEVENTDDVLIEEGIRYFKEIGCQIAIDDFGAGHSNFERIWRLEPDMVKLDRSMITRATYGKRLNFSLSRLVALLHEAGCLVVAEGIETEEEALVALDANVDLVQGYYFSKPFSTIDQPSLNTDKCHYIHDIFRKKSLKRTITTKQLIEPYLNHFTDFIVGLKSNDKYSNAVEINNRLLNCYKVDMLRRIYAINVNGYMIGSDIIMPDSSIGSNLKLNPLTNTGNSNWYHRPYFRKAIDSPNTIHCSGPYLSVTDAALCVTLSAAILLDGQTVIICFDIDWTYYTGTSPVATFIPQPLGGI